VYHRSPSSARGDNVCLADALRVLLLLLLLLDIAIAVAVAASRA
jgi:hypothetical protein